MCLYRKKSNSQWSIAKSFGRPNPSSTMPKSQLTPHLTANSLDDLLLQCIDEVLADLLGRKPTEAVYDHLERNHSLARNQIPRHLSIFQGLLEEAFGKGSRTITRSIIKRMYDKLEWEFVDVPSFELEDYLEAIRARIARTLLEHAKPNSFSQQQE